MTELQDLCTDLQAIWYQQIPLSKAMDMRITNPKISAPTLVICGEQDTGTTPQQAKEIAEAVPSAKLELINNAAHLANIEQHEVFNSLLSTFLGDLDI